MSRRYDDDILITKLVSPAMPQSLVPRQALQERLDNSFDRKLTLICAPAGFGKTTLVSQWIAKTQQPAAWLSLDAGDNDPLRFWRYMIAACQSFQDGLGASALEHLLECQQPRYEMMMTRLINELASLPLQYGLILEDYHVLTADEIHTTMAFLLDHLPPNLHLILMTRHEPPLPLARLRARGELGEFGTDDLRFSAQEIEDFLHQTVSRAVSPAAINHLEARTEGWAAGLRLAVLSLQNKPTPGAVNQFLETFNGSHQHVADYLFSEVFSAQSESVRVFLLQTACLSRLCAELCEAVTGRDDSGRVLEHLQSANLFLIPLDGTWYRYHALFAAALQLYAKRALGEAALQDLHRKASQWYAAHGFAAEAIEAALLAEDFEGAAELISATIKPFYKGNEYHTLRRWIDTLPSLVRDSHPTIALNYVAAVLFTSDRRTPEIWSKVAELLQVAESYWRNSGDNQKLGEVMVFRSMVAWWQGNFAETFSTIRYALQLLPEDDVPWRGMCLIGVGLEEVAAGNLETALRVLLEARTLCETSGILHAVYAAMQTLGEVYFRRGELHLAEQYHRQLLAEVGTDEAFLDYRAQSLIGLAALAYEWNDLALAEQHTRAAMEIGRRLNFNLEDTLVRGSLLLVRLLAVRGDFAQAHELLNALSVELRNSYFSREIRAQQGWLALVMGDMMTAQQWYSSVTHVGEAAPPNQQEREVLIGARLLIAQGEINSALELLKRWQVDAHLHERGRSALEICLLKALAHHKIGEAGEAHQLMKQALELARFEGYRRLFLDEGEPLRGLLRETLSDLHDDRLVSYARSLLVAFVKDQAEHGATSSPEAPLKPLSLQEERILQLLASGLSNPEIARHLVVSINTIKTQVKSIFRKLNVTNRDEAADVARHLGLC